MKFFLALLAIALLWGGAQGVYTGLRNRTAHETTCGQLSTERPDAEWLSFAECEYDLENLAYGGLLTSVSELYIPLRPKGDSSNAPPKVVLLTKDAQLLDLVRVIESAPDSQDVSGQLERLVGMATPERVTGLVKFGIELDDDDVEKLKGLYPNLPKDFLLVHDGERPKSVLLSFALLGAGLLLGAWALLLIVRSMMKRSSPSG